MKAVAIFCVDGRLEGTRARVREFVGTLGYEIPQGGLYGLTKAGPDAALCGVRGEMNQESVCSDIELLQEKGVELGVIVLVSHEACAGHPVDNEVHIEDTKKAGEMLHSRFKKDVVCLIDERISDGEWKLSHIATIS